MLYANEGPQKLDNCDKLQKSIKCEHLLIWIGHPGLQIRHMFVWSQHKPHFLRRSTTRGTQWVNRNFPFCGWQSSKVHFSRGNSEWRMEWKEERKENECVAKRSMTTQNGSKGENQWFWDFTWLDGDLENIAVFSWALPLQSQTQRNEVLSPIQNVIRFTFNLAPWKKRSVKKEQRTECRAWNWTSHLAPGSRSAPLSLSRFSNHSRASGKWGEPEID